MQLFWWKSCRCSWDIQWFICLCTKLSNMEESMMSFCSMRLKAGDVTVVPSCRTNRGLWNAIHSSESGHPSWKILTDLCPRTLSVGRNGPAPYAVWLVNDKWMEWEFNRVKRARGCRDTRGGHWGAVPTCSNDIFASDAYWALPFSRRNGLALSTTWNANDK